VRQSILLSILSIICFSSNLNGNGAYANPVVSGHISAERVNTLTGSVEWNESLKEALAKAQSEAKPVVWVHMVGKIDGAT
jgi:hypothetical protein